MINVILVIKQTTFNLRFSVPEESGATVQLLLSEALCYSRVGFTFTVFDCNFCWDISTTNVTQYIFSICYIYLP